jgi:hypothetical protein
MQYRSPEMVDVYQRRPIDEKAGASLLGRDPHTALGPEADCAHCSLGQTSGRSASSSTSSATTRRPCTWTSSPSQAPGHLTERPPAGCSEEHGPLAILNVQYRVPPYPVYSNQLNLLVGTSVRPLLRSTRGADWCRRSSGSMLQEHGSQRPSAVQLLKTVHSMRGTRPANHYVRPRCLSLSGGSESNPNAPLLLVRTSLCRRKLEAQATTSSTSSLRSARRRRTRARSRPSLPCAVAARRSCRPVLDRRRSPYRSPTRPRPRIRGRRRQSSARSTRSHRRRLTRP